MLQTALDLLVLWSCGLLFQVAVRLLKFRKTRRA
jgi:hypothetical protein